MDQPRRWLLKEYIQVREDSENNNRLKLIAHVNFSENQLETCSDVPFGKCLCGKTAETGLIEYSQCSLEEHGMQYGEFELQHFLLDVYQ